MENERIKGTAKVAERPKRNGVPFKEKSVSNNVQVILDEIKWVKRILDLRIQELNSNEELSVTDLRVTNIPDISGKSVPYTDLIEELVLSLPERILLIVSLMRTYSPETFTLELRDESKHIKLKYAEFGGYIDVTFSQYNPTLQTVLFLLSGKDKNKAAFHKLELQRFGTLVRSGIVQFDVVQVEAEQSSDIQHVPILAAEYIHYIETGEKPRPDFGKHFPASLVQTTLNWEDLILPERTRNDIEDILIWTRTRDRLKDNPKINMTYPCLFYGPPGTGKTLTAKLIGKSLNRQVFKIDLSMVVSKYVGETEKNLAHLFDRAQGKDWILFFDEADSLFSKRTDVGNANDKWANLEVSFLLQKMEEYTGLTILTTNKKGNLDRAMIRRFQHMIYFPKPKKEERAQMWQALLPPGFDYDPIIDVPKLSKHEFSGANIANILKQCCSYATYRDENILRVKDLERAVKKEFIKEDRTP